MEPYAFPALVSTAFTATTATLANISGLSQALAPAAQYRFKAFGKWSGSTTSVTLKMLMSFPASPTMLSYSVMHSHNAAGAQTQFSYTDTGTGTASTAAAVASTKYAWRIDGYIQPSVAGNLIVQASNGAASGTLTIDAGAVLLVEQIS